MATNSKLKNWNFLILISFLFIHSTSLALTSGVELELSLEEKLAASRLDQNSHVSKAKLLLDSQRMDPIFSTALKIVLEKNIRSERNFAQLGQSTQKLDPDQEKLVTEYLNEVTSQAKYFYELTKTAHRNDIEGFNQICSVMLPQMETLTNLEKRLVKHKLINKVMKVSSAQSE